jgi:hypothetical protein
VGSHGGRFWCVCLLCTHGPWSMVDFRFSMPNACGDWTLEDTADPAPPAPPGRTGDSHTW